MRQNRSGLGYNLRHCGPLQSLLEEPSTFCSVSVSRWTDPPYAPLSARTGYRIPASTRPFGADHNLHLLAQPREREGRGRAGQDGSIVRPYYIQSVG